MKRFVQALNETLGELLDDDPRVCVFGESIEDPYGGAFKVTKGLSERFPGRVFDTPISEAAITGLAGGMALRGQLPVMEIMFGDFLSLCLDQLLNSITKFRAMYGDPLDVPVVVRAAMGGKRGYGPTHSQSLEKLYLGIPELLVVAPSHLHDVRALLRHLVLEQGAPSLFVEHKLLYPERLLGEDALAELGFAVETCGAPLATLVVRPRDLEPDVTLVTYGGMVPEALGVAQRLAEAEEIGVELVLPARIAPLDLAPVLASLSRTRKGVVAEEGTRAHGFGAELVCRVHEEGAELDHPLVRLAAPDAVLPSCRELELEMLPGASDLERAILALV